MATIKIDNLSVTGSEFFSDSESYLDQLTELSENDALSIKGGTDVVTIIVHPVYHPPIYHPPTYRPPALI
ncbi:MULTISPECIES: hypothetical protein [unclassified Nostoc]|uniref:hypothetical protein n=1 Tax=unclassified Nostoc TaxID=2593658 RepID=UPI002603AF92|nr:hypothetical protein [Nostoc sp. S13]MDF5737741.1 hypothetical protein [Nostoc sp. S13]